ncbi:hypothetical protein [Pelomonas aquatica]|jgi:hypothetical protein|uniref:Uncharacterized protein n=1 Tax=Pelomonas aquatica TaxID=431058 RepID=A0A9X4LCT2_9BURK|nr:hypothetical protein [Pelomonas aquatica]MCY4753813.1 hypothetical protein [Pelomonas aquatica]MDG0861140.1 hypothetical protein [Pelomonas aquatica]
MNRLCTVPHCDQPTVGRSNKCNAHRLALRRHGHPLQTGIKVTEFGPYREAIRRLWRANDASPLWVVMKARWGRCLDHAKTAIGEQARGVACNRHEVRAAEELLRLDSNVPFEDLASTSLALYVYAADQPYRFRSDDAFRFQLVRKVRGLDHLAIGKTWNHKRRSMRNVYRDLPPRVVVYLHGYLGAVFGEAGMLLKDHAKTRPKLEATESRMMVNAVGALR